MFIKIDNSNINLLHDFIKLNTSPFFRYFNNRNVTEAINNHIYTVVLMNNQNIIGYGHVDYEKLYWIGICILDKYKGNGYGKQLMKHLLNKAIEYKVQILNLTVDKNNIIALKLYEKFGFTKCNEDDFIIRMIKQLL